MNHEHLDRILREQEVKSLTGLSRATRWRGVRDGWFPRPVRPTPATMGWFQSDIVR